jgi:hypothetical protein
MILVGKAQTNLFRMKVLLLGLRTEIATGMQLTRGRSAYSIIKSEYSLKGNKERVLEQFATLYNAECEKVNDASICL